MAIPDDVSPLNRRTPADDVSVAPNETPVRWAGIWAGFLIALGVLVVLTSLGVAFGVSLAGSNASPSSLTTGAAWWGGISFLIALFIGGAVSSRRVAGALTSVIQGASVWVLSMVAVLYLAGSGVVLGAKGLFAALGGPALVQNAMAQVSSGSGAVGTTGMMNAVNSSATATNWITFVVIIVSAIAAIVGALVARRRMVA
jgi:hypothetical protein